MSKGPADRQSPTMIRRVIEMQEMRAKGMTYVAIAKEYGLSDSYVSALVRGIAGPQKKGWNRIGAFRSHWRNGSKYGT